MRTARLTAAAAVGTCLFFFVASTVAIADDPQLTSVTVDRPAVGDIVNLLHVKKLTGEFQFDAPVKEVTLVLEFYHKGVKIEEAPEVKATIKIHEVATSGKFAIHVADIDYLQLGDAPKNHCRVHIGLELGKSTLNAKEIDVPKYQFDLGQWMIGNPCDFKSQDGSSRPIFTFTNGKTRQINMSPRATVQSNPDADIVIGYLEFAQ